MHKFIGSLLFLYRNNNYLLFLHRLRWKLQRNISNCCCMFSKNLCGCTNHHQYKCCLCCFLNWMLNYRRWLYCNIRIVQFVYRN